MSPPATEQQPLPVDGEEIRGLDGEVYRIGRYMTGGFFSHVFECEDEWQNRLVAKFPKPQALRSDLTAHAKKELHNLLSARSPFVTHVAGVSLYRDTPAIFIERGITSIQDLIARDWFDPKFWVVAIARCMLQGVRDIHRMGLVHKDIHPGNVFGFVHEDVMYREGPGTFSFKVGDLGISEKTTELSEQSIFNSNIRPPEVLDKKEFGEWGPAMDVYQCGLVLLSLITKTDFQFSLAERLNGEPRNLALALGEPWSGPLERALRRHVKDRTGSATQFWREIKAIR